MKKEEIIAELIYYYEVDLNNCTMTHKDWIEEIAKALTDKDYLDTLKKEIEQYHKERKDND